MTPLPLAGVLLLFTGCSGVTALTPEAEVNVEGTRPEGPRRVTAQPITEIIAGISMILGGDRGEHGGLVSLVYKPSANVEVPLAYQPTGPIGVPAPTRPSGVPDLPSMDAVVHHVRVGESLWKPYQDIKLVRVVFEVDRAGGVFARPDASAPNGVREDFVACERLSGLEPTQAAGPESRRFDRVMHISKATATELVDHHDRIRRDLDLEAYTGRARDPATGAALRGVRVNRAGPSIAQFGIDQGDILISVNEVPVTSQPQLFKTLKDQYDNGTRTFVGRFLSRGQFVERRFSAPDSR